MCYLISLRYELEIQFAIFLLAWRGTVPNFYMFLQLSGSTLGASLVVKDEKWYAGTREQNRTDDQVQCTSVKTENNEIILECSTGKCLIYFNKVRLY